ncbi:nucleoside-triphosphatase [Thermodesulfobacteriota bacterium]
MIVILSGQIGIGKTTICDKVIERARADGHACGGVVSRKGRDAVGRTVIRVEDVSSKGGDAILAREDKPFKGGPSAGRFHYSPEGIEYAGKAILSGAGFDLLVIDEVGRLELQGEGFASTIKEAGLNKLDRVLLVIREFLVDEAVAKLGLRSQEVVRIGYGNRDDLPDQILHKLKL